MTIALNSASLPRRQILAPEVEHQPDGRERVADVLLEQRLELQLLQVDEVVARGAAFRAGLVAGRE